MSEQFFYKLRHKPTGKFFQTARGYSWQKTNLSPTGRVYHKKPSETYVKDGFYQVIDGKSRYVPCSKNDWEIVTFKIIEVK